MATKNIAIMGMGYVGLTLSVILAKNGYKTYGIETNRDVVSRLKQGQPHFQEKGLEMLLKHQQKLGNLKILDKLPDISIDVYIISVGTPLIKESKIPNTSYINNVLRSVGEHLKKDTLVLLRSTIPVGLSRETVIPQLEKYSGLKAGKDFSYAFAPERTAEGKALIELEQNPQIIGGYDEKSVEKAANIFRNITPTVICVSTIESAEMIKLIDNSYRDIRFAFSNEIAMICENMGLDASELIKAANTHYPRNNIPAPSPGVGGACLSKDPYILIDFSYKRGYLPELIKRGRIVNEKIPSYIINRIEKKITSYGKELRTAKIFIMGFAFKGDPETSDLRESTTIYLLEELKKIVTPDNIYGYDPVVSEQELSNLGMNLCKTPDEGCQNADIVMIMNNHLSYMNLDPYRITSKMNKPGIFYDSWRMFDKNIFDDIKDITYLGVGH